MEIKADGILNNSTTVNITIGSNLVNDGRISLGGSSASLSVSGVVTGTGSISGGSGNLEFSGFFQQGKVSLESGPAAFGGECSVSGDFTGGSGDTTFGGKCSVSGDFTAGSGRVDFGADCTVEGTLTASSGTTVFEGNLEAGAFVHNNGVTEFSGTVQNLRDSGTGGSLDFNEVFITAGTDVLAFLDLTVAGNLTNNGNLTFSGTAGMKVDGTTSGSGSITAGSGNLVFTGDCAQNSISSNSGSLTFAGNCTLTGNFTAGSGTATFGKDCSVGGIFSASTGTTVFKGNLEAQDFVHNGGTAEFSGSQSQNVTGANFTSLYRIYIDKPSSDIEFSGPVNFADLTAAACRNITFSKSVTGTGLSESSDTVKISSSGDILFLEGLSIEKGNFVVTGGNSLTAKSAVTLKAGNAELNLNKGEISFDQTVEITGNCTLTGGRISIFGGFNSKDLTVNNSGLFLLKASLAADNFTQNDYGTGENQIQGDITSNGTIVFENDVFIGLTGESGGIVFKAGTGETINIKGDLFIARDFTPETSIKAQNILLASGKVTLRNGNSFEAEKDLILLGAGADFDDGASGVTGLFSYFNPGRDGLSIAKPSLSALPSKFPDGTMFPDGTSIPFAGTFSDLTGVNLKAGKNFYANGIDLEGTGNWNLYLPDNSSALSAFAEAYNLTVSNSTVICSSSGSAWVAAGENCSDGGGNSNWDFTKPENMKMARPAPKPKYTMGMVQGVLSLSVSAVLESVNMTI